MPETEQSPSNDPHKIFREADSEDFSERYDIRKLFAGIRRHIPTLVICSLLGGLLGAYVSHYIKHTFKAESIVIYHEDKTQPSNQSKDLDLTRFNLATAMDIIKIPANLQAVKSILGLDIEVQQLDGMIDIPFPRSDSNLIHIVVKAKNPHLAIDIANTLARAAVKNSQNYNQMQLQTALDNYKSELENTRRKLASQNQDIEEFKRNHQYFEMDAEYIGLLTQLREARANLQSATLKYNSLLIEYENLKRENEALPDRVPMNAESGGTIVDQRLSSLQSALAEARAKYAPDNPKVKALESQLAAMLGQQKDGSEESALLTPNVVKERIGIELMRMQGKVRAAEKIKQELEQNVSSFDKEVSDLPSQQMQMSKLLTARKISEDQLRSLNAAAENTQLLLNIPRGTIELFQDAEKARPLREGLLWDLLPFIMLGMGLLGGVIISLLLEMNDPHLYTKRQIELAYTIPPLMEVPRISLHSDHAEKDSLFYIRTLAERLEKGYSNENDACSICITSSQDGEGKSWIAYYLARYYANHGKKTILLILDPVPNHALPLNAIPSKSIDLYLHGKGTINDVIKEGQPSVIQLKTFEPKMKELIKSSLMKGLWDRLKADYEMIVVDSPSIIEHHYAANLSSLTDLTVFIINSPETKKDIVDESLTELIKVGEKPFGIVLNNVPEQFIRDKRTLMQHKRKKASFFTRWFR